MRGLASKMGERYVISGVQLGALQTESNLKKRKEIVTSIIDKQFIGRSVVSMKRMQNDSAGDCEYGRRK